MQTLFVLIKCELGATYRVAEELVDTFDEIRSVHSISGEYDLLAKFYIEDDQDIGHFVNETIHDIPGIHRTFTTLTFKAF